MDIILWHTINRQGKWGEIVAYRGWSQHKESKEMSSTAVISAECGRYQKDWFKTAVLRCVQTAFIGRM